MRNSPESTTLYSSFDDPCHLEPPRAPPQATHAPFLPPNQTDLPDTVERVLIAAFTTRNTMPLGAFVVLGIIAMRLKPEALERLLRDLLANLWFSIGGWLLFSLSIVVSIRVFRWREGLFERELRRRQGELEKPQAGQLEMKLEDKKD